MTTPHLDVVHGKPLDRRLAAGPGDGPAAVHLSGPVHLHIHAGGPPERPAAAARPPRSLLWPVLLGAALLGGGYALGLRTAASVGEPAASAAPGNAALPPPPASGLPAPPSPPPALQRQLARPPVVTPPAGAAPAGRNPFGFSD